MSDLAPDAADERTVLITRVFEAPREQVFRAWTDPDEVAGWYGPAHMESRREVFSPRLQGSGVSEL